MMDRAQWLRGRLGASEIFWAAVGGAAVLIYSAAGRFVIGGDTSQYLHHSIYRPPLYPVLLDLVAWIGCSLQAVVVLQSFFVVACAFYLGLVLRCRLNLAPWAFCAAYFLLLVPLLPSKSIYFSMWGLIGRDIMTEAFSYGIFLLTYGFMVDSVYEPSIRNFSLFAALAVLNTMVRDQFLFVYAAVPVFWVWSFYRSRDGRRLAVLAAVFTACLLAGRATAALCARRYPAGSVTRNHLKTCLFPDILFFSGPEDLSRFAGRPYYPILERIYQGLNTKKYFARFHEEMNEDLVSFHDSRFPLIYEEACRVIQSDIRAAELSDDQTFLASVPIADGVVASLLGKYWKDYARFVAHEFAAGFSFRHGLAVGCFAACWLWGLRRPPDIIALLTAVLVAANHAVTALTMFLDDRHLFYTDTFALLFVVLLIGYRDSLEPMDKAR